MMILRGLVLILKIGFAIGCVVGGIMLFPIWYEVCGFVKDMILAIAPGLDSLMTLYLNFFPYLSLFLMGLAVYIGFIKLLDNIAGSGDEGLD